MNAEVISVHPASKQGRNPVLKIFDVPSTDISINDFRISTFSPVGTSITPMEFNIPEMQEYVDLTRSYFKLILKLRKTDGKPLKTADDLYLVNNLAHSMIKQFVVRLNGALLSPHTDTYPYKAYIETLLNYNRDDGETLLRPEGWVNAIDVPEVYEPTGSGNSDPKQNDWTQNQKDAHTLLAEETKLYINDDNNDIQEIHLKFKPMVEPFRIPHLLKPGVAMTFQVYFNNPDFFSIQAKIGASKQLRLQAEDVDMRFHLCRLKLNSAIYNELQDDIRLRGKWARYPVVRGDVRTFTFAGDTLQRFEEDDIFNGRVPHRVVIGILNNKAFNGDITYYPFAFQKAGVKTIKQIISGEEYPYEPLELTDDQNFDYDGYYRWLQASGCLIKQQPNMIREKDWGTGRNGTLFMFNNVGSGNADIKMLNPNKKGTLRLEIDFHSVPGWIATIVVFGEFENLIEIDPNGSVVYDIYQ